MGLWDSLKAAVGIGGPKLLIELAAPQVAQGQAVRGVVKLQGGERDTPVAALKVRVNERWMERRHRSYEHRDVHGAAEQAVEEVEVPMHRVLAEQTLRQGFTAAAGGVEEFPFEVSLPQDAYPSSRDTRWDVEAAADIPGALDAGARADLAVVASPAVAAAKLALATTFGLDPAEPWLIAPASDIAAPDAAPPQATAHRSLWL